MEIFDVGYDGYDMINVDLDHTPASAYLPFSLNHHSQHASGDHLMTSHRHLLTECLLHQSRRHYGRPTIRWHDLAVRNRNISMSIIYRILLAITVSRLLLLLAVVMN